MAGPRTVKEALDEARKEFPDVQLVMKSESRLMRAIGAFLTVASFGKNRDFMRSYYTTIGTTVYLPTAWETSREESRTIVLRHEVVHMRQARRYGRLLFSLLYLFAFLPVGLAYFRAKFEKEAYEESLRARAELLGPDSLGSPELRRAMVGHFVGPDYLWAWPFRKSVERWYSEAVERIKKEIGQS